MNHCCLKTVPQSDSSYETLAGPVADWQARLTASLNQSVQACNEHLGHLEEHMLRQTRGLERQLLAEATQKKADQTPPVCPVCGHPLSQRTRDHERTFQSCFGVVRFKRLRGWCRRCQAWRYPADQALGLSDTGGASPSVQEMAALTVSKMPVKEASAVIERLTGVRLPPATLDREARRQGQRANRKRQQLDERQPAPVGGGARAAPARPSRGPPLDQAPAQKTSSRSRRLAVKRPAHPGQMTVQRQTPSHRVRTALSGKPPGANGLRGSAAGVRTAGQWRDGIDLPPIPMRVQAPPSVLDLRGR